MKAVAVPSPSPELAAVIVRTAAEVTALVRLAELDGVEATDERRALEAKLPPLVLEAYERAVRGGRRPAVVSLVASVCSGCHMRLHSALEQKIRRRQGVAPCPHCFRLVFDPSWLEAAAPRG